MWISREVQGLMVVEDSSMVIRKSERCITMNDEVVEFLVTSMNSPTYLNG